MKDNREIYTWESNGRKIETTEVGDGELQEMERMDPKAEFEKVTQKETIFFHGYKL